MKLAIIIPTFQEEKNLKKLLPEIFKFQPQAKIVVVDDNSGDGTLSVIKVLRKTYPGLILISRLGERGRGTAVLGGFKYALENLHSDHFIEMDADFSHAPKELKNLILLSEADNFVVASRYLKSSQILDWPLKRKVGSLISNFLIRFILKLPIRDNTNGYRAYQKKAVSLLLRHQFISRNYMVLSESAYLLFRKGFHPVEIPTVFLNRKKGKSNTNLGLFITSLIDLLKIRIFQN